MGAPTYAAGNSNLYWYSSFTAREDTPGSGVSTNANNTFGTVTQAIGFSGLVSFTTANNVSDGSNILSFGVGGATLINGSNISTGRIASTNLITGSGFQFNNGQYVQRGSLINLDSGSIHTTQFYVSSSGDAVFKGKLTAGGMSLGTDVNGTNDGIYINATNYWYDNGTISIGGGNLTWNGSTLTINGNGTFSGNLSAAGGSFTGELVAASGYFSGSLAATNGYIGNWVLTGPLLYASANNKKVQLSANIPSVELYSGTSLVVDINANTTLSPKSSTPPTFGASSIGQSTVLTNQGYTAQTGTEWYYSGGETTGGTTSFSIGAGSSNIGKTCIISAVVGGATSNRFESSGDDIVPTVYLVYQKYNIEYGFKLTGPGGYVSYNSIYYDGSQVRGGLGPYVITQAYTSQTLSTSLILAEGTYTITPYVRGLYAGSVMNRTSPPATFDLDVVTPSLSSIEASIPISKTEIGAGGFQVVFSTTRYLEVQRADNANFVAVGGGITATGNITAYYSDKRLKNILGNIDNPLDKIQKLNGVYYEENELAKSFGYDNDGKQVGLIAQEVEEVLPEIIHLAPFDDDKGVSKSGENYMTVQYDRVIPLLVESIKELKKEIEELKNNK